MLARCLLCLLLASPALADGDDATLGPAGLLSAGNRERLPGLTLSAGAPLAEMPLTLKSGTHYQIEIEADGSQELGLAGPGFFHAIWIDELVVEGIEIRPLGLDSLEFDEAGTLEMTFIAIKPGSYDIFVPNSRGDLQRLAVTIE